jgi:sirohydrochlorin cobaltochelatase
MSRAVLLFAHGARDPEWAAPFRAVAARLRHSEPTVAVELAFLELMAPDLPEAARRLVRAGASRIEVLPLFLGTGGHLRKDLPPLLEAVRREHPGVPVRLHAAIGESESVIAAMAGAAAAVARLGE